MPSKSWLVAGLAACVVLVLIVALLFRPQIYIGIGHHEYEKAGSISEKVQTLYAEKRDSEHTMWSIESAEFSKSQARLKSKEINHYERAVGALSLGKRLRPSALDDEDLVVLADSRIRALGGSYPSSRHTISQTRKAMSLVVSDLEEALALNERNKEAYSLLINAHIRFREPNPEKAVEVCGRFEKAFPNDATMFAACGIAYASAGDQDSARDNCEKAVELDPASIASLYLYGILWRDGKGEEAKAIIERYLESDLPPDEAQVAKDMLRQEAETERRLEEVQEKYKENPDDFDVVREVAEALSQSRQHDLAYEWHKKAYKMRPNDEWALRRLADFHMSRDPDAAVQLYKKLLMMRGDGSTMGLLGQAYYRAGNLEEALSWYKKAEAASEEHYGTLFSHIAECYDKMGNEEMADKYGRKYIAYRKKISRNLR